MVTVLPTANTTPYFKPTADSATPTPLASNVSPTAFASPDNPVASTIYSSPAGPVLPTPTISSNQAAADVSKIQGLLADENKAIADQKLKTDALALGAPTQTATITGARTQQQMDAANAGADKLYIYNEKGERIGKAAPTEIGLGSLLDTPDAGHIFGYNPNDGTKIQVPLAPGQTIDQALAAYGLQASPLNQQQTTTSVGGIQQTIPMDVGSEYGASVAKLGNGTYAALDDKGNIIRTISADDFAKATESSSVYKKQLETQAANELEGQLTQITNGTYPLKPWQIDQLNNVKQQYANLIAEQKIANANFEEGTKTYQGLLGMSEYSPGVAMGALKVAVDQGISKIAALNAEMASTIGKMTQAFQKDNFDQLKTLYDIHEKNIEKRQAEIDKLEERIIKAKDDAQKRADTLEQNKIENKYKEDTLALQRDTLTWRQKMDIIESDLNNAKFTEEQRKNRMDEKLRLMKLQQDAGPSFNPNVPFAGTIARISNIMPKSTKDDVLQNINNAAERGDYKLLLGQLKDQVQKHGIMGADATKLLKAETDVAQLNNFEKAIRAYKDKGGDMGLLVGKSADIATKLGQRYSDGELQVLATQLNNAFFAYRQAMTGAAFGAKESAEYGSVVPSPSDTYELSLDKIEGARRFTDGYVDSVYTSKMDEGYTNLKELAQQQDDIESLAAYAKNTGGTVAEEIQAKLDAGDNPDAIRQFYGI